MSIIKIAYNEISHLAQSTSASSENANFSHENLFYGGSTIYWERGTAGTSTNFDFTLPSGVTRKVEYVYLRNVLPLLDLSNFSVELRGSTDNFSSSDVLVLDTGNVTAANCGSYNEDYFFKGSISGAYRYWRVVLKTTSSVIARVSKIYFGELFSFTRSPVYPYSRNYVTQVEGFSANSGAIFSTANGRASRGYNLKWTHFSNDARNDFEKKIGKLLKNYPIVLVEDVNSDHKVLDNKASFGFARYEIQSPVWKDIHHLDLEFREDILG